MSTLHVDLPEPMAAADLLRDLARSYPALDAALPAVRVAVNREYVQGHHLVHPGDEVALITPVSGG